MTALSDAADPSATTSVNVSSLVDTWLTLSNAEADGMRSRTFSIVKARGMGHSNQTHELVMSKNGVEIRDQPASRISA
jgi:circadian clock protein KaiC